MWLRLNFSWLWGVIKADLFEVEKWSEMKFLLLRVVGTEASVKSRKSQGEAAVPKYHLKAKFSA